MTENNSTLVRGDDLRRLRKRAFKSADAFAAACESVSVPTIYRAERGGPILKTYLNRMARELEVDVERLMVPLDENGEARAADLTGAWFGLILATDRFGHPFVIGEDIQLTQIGDRVEGRSVYRESNETMIDVFENAQFEQNVLCGQIRSEKWPFPLECAAFVLSGGRDLSWLDGYISWFDLDSEQTQFSKYIVIRKGTERFKADVKSGHRIMDTEAKLLRTRRFLESGYNFATALSLVTAVEDTKEEEHPSPPSAPDVEETAAPPQDRPVIAIASFAVLNEDRSQAFFAEGLIDDIATELSRTDEIDVLPRNAFSRDDSVSQETAAEKGASHVLSGTMRRSENRLRVNAQLMDAETGKIVWAERYDHEAETAFAMHDVIAHDLLRSLRREVMTQAPSISSDTSDSQAYELFLKGRSLYLRGIYTPTLRAAEGLLVRATELDPGFARAYAQLSICRSYLALSTQNSTVEETVPAGLSDAQKALEITPNLPLGNAALGLAHYATGEYRTAEPALLKAIEQDKSLFEPHFFLARNTHLEGDRAGAAERFAMALRMRPDDFRSCGLLAEELRALNRPSEAQTHFRSALKLIEKELEDHPDNAGALAFGAPILVHLGHKDRAQVWAEWARAIAPEDCLVLYNIARSHALAGAKRNAVEHLRSAFDVPYVVRRRLVLWMKYDDDFQNLAGDPKFEDLKRAAMRP